jgi:hypothetical protein
MAKSLALGYMLDSLISGPMPLSRRTWDYPWLGPRGADAYPQSSMLKEHALRSRGMPREHHPRFALLVVLSHLGSLHRARVSVNPEVSHFA